MRTNLSLFMAACAGLLLITQATHAQETVFSTGFEYGDDFPFVFEPSDLNGAEGQIGEWSGPVFPEGIGDILTEPDSVGIVPSPYGGYLMVLDRPTGDIDGNDLTGSYFAEFTQPVTLLGAAVSFQVGSRRTDTTNEKDYDIVGRGSNGEESFRLRVGTNNSGGERLGYVTDDGATVVFDLPTIVGEDRPADVDNMAGFNQNDGPGFGQEITNVNLLLGPTGFTIDFSYPEEATSPNKNAYTSALLPYNGNATDLAQLEFTYESSTANPRNSGYVLDEISVSGFQEVLQGDFNFDGALTEEDFGIIRDNFLTGSSYEQGDFNFDGFVNIDDFAGLKAAVSQTGAAVVPEPGGRAMLLVVLAAFSLLRRRATRRVAMVTVGIAAAAASAQATDFDGRYIRVTGNPINSTAEALDILRGRVTRNIVEDVTGKVAKIDLGGGTGSFDETVGYLNGTTDTSKDDFLQQMTGIVTIPAGDWSIGLGSDDGATVIIPGVEFTERYNANGNTADHELRFNATRSYGWTMGEFTLSEPLTTQFEAVVFDRGGGDSFEVAILEGPVGANDPTDFEILGDGVLGWEIVDYLPGDFDLDGNLAFADFLTLANNFGSGTQYAQGDINFSGRVDLADFVQFRQLFLNQGVAGAAAVPEPNATTLIGAMLLCGLGCRRRR